MRVTVHIEDDSGQTYEGELVLSRAPKGTKASAPRRKAAPTGTPTTPTEGLKQLHRLGIFKSERSLGAVDSELSKIDCNFPKASLAKALERADFLTCKGKRGDYRWIQRFKARV
jgi:hypothetical protein